MRRWNLLNTVANGNDDMMMINVNEWANSQMEYQSKKEEEKKEYWIRLEKIWYDDKLHGR